MAKAHLVKKDTPQPMNDLCEETYGMGLYHTTSTNTVKPYVCTVSMAGTVVTIEIDA